MKTKITAFILLTGLLLSIGKNSHSQFSSFQKLVVSDVSSVYGTAPFHKPGPISPSPEQVVCFSAQIATPGKFDIAILKIDSSGFITANKILTKNPGFHDWARGLTKLGANYYMTGSSRAFDTSSFYYESTYLVKFDAGLNVLSQTNYFLPDREIFGSAITATADNNILITGTTIYNSNRAAFLLKADTSGNIIWFRQYPATVDITYVRELSNGDIMVCGSLAYAFQFIQPIAMHFNSTGGLLSATNFIFATGPFDYQNSTLEFIHDFGNGNVLLAGRTDYSGFSIGFMDSYAIMMNVLTGNITWAKVFGAFQNDWPSGYSVNLDNNLVICGSTGSFFNYSNYGFAQVIDTSGTLLSSYAFGDTAVQEQLTLTGFRQMNAAKNLIIGFKSNLGSFNFYRSDFSSAPIGGCPVYPVSFSTVNVAYPPSIFGVSIDNTLTPYTNNDNFNTYTGVNEMLLCSMVTSANDFTAGKNDVTIFPNPADRQLEIHLKSRFTSVDFFNVTGEQISNHSLKQGINSIDVSDLESGIYFLKLKSQDGVNVTEKLIVTHD